MYPYHVFDLEPAGTFRMHPICYRRVSGRYIQPEPAMYSKCFHWFPGPLAPSVTSTAAESTSLSRRSLLVVLLLTTLLLITLLPSSVGIRQAGRSDVDLGRLLLNDSSHSFRKSLKSVPNRWLFRCRSRTRGMRSTGGEGAWKPTKTS